MRKRHKFIIDVGDEFCFKLRPEIWSKEKVRLVVCEYAKHCRAKSN